MTGGTNFSVSVASALQLLLSAIAKVRGTFDGQTASAAMMMAYVVSEDRLLWLKPSDWSVLLVGVALCGMLTLLF